MLKLLRGDILCNLQGKWCGRKWVHSMGTKDQPDKKLVIKQSYYFEPASKLSQEKRGWGGEETLFSCPTIPTRRLTLSSHLLWQCQPKIVVARRGWSTANVINYVTFRWSFVGCMYCPNVTQSTLASRRSVGHKNEVFKLILKKTIRN